MITLRVKIDGRAAMLELDDTAAETDLVRVVREALHLKEPDTDFDGLAAALDLSKTTIARLWKKRVLPGRKVGRRVTFDIEECRSALDARYRREAKQ